MNRFPSFTQKASKGFTLVELMIVVAIVGILAAIAVPSYQQYTRKGKFSEVVAAAAPYKLAVELCYQDGTCQGTTAGTITVDTVGRWGGQIPADLATAKRYVNAVAVSATGVVTATAVAGEGLSGRTYILTPSVNLSDNSVVWAKSGTCATSPAIC